MCVPRIRPTAKEPGLDTLARLGRSQLWARTARSTWLVMPSMRRDFQIAYLTFLNIMDKAALQTLCPSCSEQPPDFSDAHFNLLGGRLQQVIGDGKGVAGNLHGLDAHHGTQLFDKDGRLLIGQRLFQTEAPLLDDLQALLLGGLLARYADKKMRVRLEPILALLGAEGEMDAQMLHGKGVPADLHTADRIFNGVVHDFLLCIRHAPATGAAMPPQPSSKTKNATKTEQADMNTAPTAGVISSPQ